VGGLGPTELWMNERTDCPIIYVSVSLSSSYMDTDCFALKKKKYLSVSGGRPLVVEGLGPGPFGTPKSDPAAYRCRPKPHARYVSKIALRLRANVKRLAHSKQASLYSFTQFDIYIYCTEM
jgi:hypothetical protein